jgi:hypothetical protein
VAATAYVGRVELRLPFPPTPEHMADHAAYLVETVRRIDGEDLDFGATSLETVDRLLGRFHDAGDDPNRVAETVFQFGSYIGEVIVRQAHGTWVTVPDDHPLGRGWQPLVELPGERMVNPIGKAFKRVANGRVDSIPYFYKALVAS